jgi:hypothetical protein
MMFMTGRQQARTVALIASAPAKYCSRVLQTEKMYITATPDKIMVAGSTPLRFIIIRITNAGIKEK